MDRQRGLTRILATLTAGLYAVGLLWLAPASPHPEALFAFVGLLLLGHWTLWHPWAGRQLARVASPARPSAFGRREISSLYSQGVLGVSTGFYVVGLARVLFQ